MVEEVGPGLQAVLAQPLPHHFEHTSGGRLQGVADFATALVHGRLQGQAGAEALEHLLHLLPLPSLGNVLLPTEIRQALGTETQVRPGLQNPNLGLGEMQLSKAQPGRGEVAAAQHANAAVGIGGEAAAEILQTRGLRRLQADIEIEQEQPLHRRGLHGGHGRPLRATPGAATALRFPEVAADVGIPAEIPADRLDAVVTPAAPTLQIRTGLLQGLLKHIQIGDVSQLAVGATLKDVPRPTVVGAHQGQATGGRLQQGQAKGLGQGWIDEDPAALGRPAVDGRNLLAPMLLGIGDLAVEIEAINEFKDLLELVPLLLLHGAGILPAAEHQHQVVALLQEGRAPVGLDQGGDVLTPHRPADREQR